MYAKLFERLLRSSIMDAELPVRWLWIVLLVLADRDGYVTATDTALARHANLTIDQVRHALDVLTSPDPASTTPDHEGRRLIPVGPNTWWLPNYVKYRGLQDEDAQRAATKERVQRWRERAKPQIASADANEPAAEKEPQEAAGATRRFRPPTVEEVREYLQELQETRFTADQFVDFYTARGWRTTSGPVKDWRACVRTWRRRADEKQAARGQRPAGTARDILGMTPVPPPGRCHGCGCPSEETFCSACRERYWGEEEEPSNDMA